VKQLERMLWRVVDATLFVTIVGMVLLIGFQVGSRIIGGSIPWTEELGRLLFIWTVWLGIAAGFRWGQQPAIELFVGRLPQGARSVASAFSVFCTVIFFSVIAWNGVQLLRQQIQFGEVSAILQIGQWVTTVPLVLGTCLSIVGAIMQFIEMRNDRRDTGPEGSSLLNESQQQEGSLIGPVKPLATSKEGKI